MKKQPWYIEKGKESDVVVSSRIRLARNIKGYPFSPMLDDKEAKELLSKIKNASKNLSLSYLSMEQMPAIKRQMLVERHIISPEMLNDPAKRAVLLSNDESISIMLGEEDHIRIQCYAAGLDLKKAFEAANQVDDELSKTLEFGFNEQYGYTTCCPTNVGTGLRASCMLHLPMLSSSGYLDNIFSAVSKLGITVRGLYGEGSRARGDLYQISNQITLGISERDTITKLTEVVKTISDKERAIRNQMIKSNPLPLTDKIWRSYGILSNARLLTSNEAMNLLSDVRLGVNMGIIELPLETINDLTISTAAAHIADACGADGDKIEKRDIERANLIRRRVL